jgi:hypothetical protein
MPDVMGLPQQTDDFNTEMQENEIIRLLLNYGNFRNPFSRRSLEMSKTARRKRGSYFYGRQFIIEELERDQVPIHQPVSRHLPRSMQARSKWNCHHAGTFLPGR